MLVKRDGRTLEGLYTFDTNVHFDGIEIALYLAPVGMSCIISTRKPGVCDQDRRPGQVNTRWFKYDRDCLCVNKSQFVPVIFEPPCKLTPFTTNFWGLGQDWRTFLRTFAQIAGSFRRNSSACGNPSLSVGAAGSWAAVLPPLSGPVCDFNSRDAVLLSAGTF
jgi:hypothetical protein